MHASICRHLMRSIHYISISPFIFTPVRPGEFLDLWFSSGIPQLDSCTLDTAETNLPQPSPNLPEDTISSKQWDTCQTLFETIEHLKLHNETHQFGCDECNICFETLCFSDLHELEKHPGNFYALNSIPQSTNIQFAQSFWRIQPRMADCPRTTATGNGHNNPSIKDANSHKKK